MDTKTKPRVVVDWDGVCVKEVWPDEGDWLPGAAKALRALDELGYELVIFSCRVAPVQFGSDDPRDPVEVEREVAYIQRLLTEQELGHVEVWQRNYKPPAILYIDDRAHHFDGDWKKAVKAVLAA